MLEGKSCGRNCVMFESSTEDEQQEESELEEEESEDENESEEVFVLPKKRLRLPVYFIIFGIALVLIWLIFYYLQLDQLLFFEH